MVWWKRLVDAKERLKLTLRLMRVPSIVPKTQLYEATVNHLKFDVL